MDKKYLEEYVGKMGKLLEKRGEIEKIIDSAMALGKKNLFLVGIGGTIAVMRPFEQFFKKMSDAQVYAENAAMLITTGNRHLGKDSVCFFMSDSGNTKEIIEAIHYCKERGAVTIASLGAENSPIEKLVDYSVVNLNKDSYSSDADYYMNYMFFSYYLYKRGEFPQYEKFIANLNRLPVALAQVKEQADEQGKDYAPKYLDDNYHIFTAGGDIWGEVYCYAMCVLEEMQWIRTKSVHAADFFHGTLELVDDNTHVVLVKGEDESRPLADRIEAFCKKYTKKFTVYDTKDYALEGIDKDIRGMFAPIVVTCALGRISPHLQEVTGHDLSYRRYYKKVEY
ncbi:SIS domain-containing protein [Youxingia wuxianensis]|uniref:SIS domain-containing protein n=1 Tax=Youxingia wuxianensis TaxID=2763678 RepID=A0A926IGR6_9FIRM|nr:SIS domain-containing protein [Youxingia wuxianensis]MBC8585149.1 SIS domain-containing protein [Youxingia wuxianensis]